MKVFIFTALCIFAFFIIEAEAQVTEVNVITGESIERPYTQQELDDIDKAILEDAPARATREAFAAKKEVDIAALGSRSEMQAEAANANSIPALRTLVLKLAEVIYSNEKGTID